MAWLRLLFMAFVLGTGFGIGIARAEPTAQMIGEDRAYCASLLLRFTAAPTARQEPYRALATAGDRLCAAGHVRTGVLKLRRALRGALSS